MLSKFSLLLLVIITFVSGWFANQFWQRPIPKRVEDTILSGPITKHPRSGIALINEPNRVSSQNCNCETDTQNTPVLHPSNLSFETLLRSKRYVEALELLAQSKQSNGGDFAQLKLSLLDYLEELIASRQDSDFTEIADLHLGQYYDDLDVLLLLVKFNWNIGYYFEALNVLQLAYTYSYSAEQTKRVDDSYSLFVQHADKNLFGQKHFFELLNLYSAIEATGLLRSADKYRLAELYLLNGELVYARQILDQLSTDAIWGARAKEILTRLGDAQMNVADGEQLELGFAEQIPLQTHGSQYLVPVLLSGIKIQLVMDTGASMTTITLKNFARLRHNINFEQVGTRVFNTANGVIKGQIYRVDSIYIGRFEIRNSQIAVLDFTIGGSASGLLGMNILREFRFQIDQDNHFLRLEKR